MLRGVTLVVAGLVLALSSSFARAQEKAGP
jgi:hypothetical protein